MTLVFDIGNTNIKCAIFENDKIINIFRISTDSKKTGDEYFTIVRFLLNDQKVDSSKITKTIISSVVPVLTGPFVTVTQKLTGKKPLILGPDIYKKLSVKIPETAIHEIGTDLYSDAYGAWTKYKTPCIVCDFGTALSFTAVDKNGNIAGIAIAPGIRTAFNSLFTNTAQLPSVALEIPPTSLGKNTIVSIQSGILFGYKGLVESLISQMKIDMEKETGTRSDNVKVIATGGLNSMLSPITNMFDFVDANLTLDGMNLIASALS